MQCKDIPDEPILRLLAAETMHTMNWYAGSSNSVLSAMPLDTPERLALAKMRMLIRRGLVDGCSCGCRGDFEITAKGREWLAKKEAA